MLPGKKYKIVGEMTLLLSFLTQTLLFDYYNDRSKSLSDVYVTQSLIDKGAELRELKYFVAKFPSDSIGQINYEISNIHDAAVKLALAKSVQYASLDTPKKVANRMIGSLLIAASKVHDFNSYQNFIDNLNSRDITSQSVLNQVELIKDRKYLFRLLFIALYFLGSLSLIFGIFKETNE